MSSRFIRTVRDGSHPEGRIIVEWKPEYRRFYVETIDVGRNTWIMLTQRKLHELHAAIGALLRDVERQSHD